MANRRTSKEGVKARYFHVIYNHAEREEHFAAMREIILKGAFQTGFSAGPADDDGELAFMVFVIAEEEADDYVRRIKAARRRAAKSEQPASE